jgi:hypothetical protein
MRTVPHAAPNWPLGRDNAELRQIAAQVIDQRCLLVNRQVGLLLLHQ